MHNWRERIKAVAWALAVTAVLALMIVAGSRNLARFDAALVGYPLTFPIDSALAFFIFHGLVWSSFFVIAGVMLAMHRRMIDREVAALQPFGEDCLPLTLLFAVSVTGFVMAASYTWMKGDAYEFLAMLHTATVIFTLLWLSFGKFFHLFQWPAPLGVSFYKEVGREGDAAACGRYAGPFATTMMLRDLITVERELGFSYEIYDGKTETHQWICPGCRRAMFGLSQSALWAGKIQAEKTT